jgi:hypothetical protein
MVWLIVFPPRASYYCLYKTQHTDTHTARPDKHSTTRHTAYSSGRQEPKAKVAPDTSGTPASIYMLPVCLLHAGSSMLAAGGYRCCQQIQITRQNHHVLQEPCTARAVLVHEYCNLLRYAIEFLCMYLVAQYSKQLGLDRTTYNKRDVPHSTARSGPYCIQTKCNHPSMCRQVAGYTLRMYHTRSHTVPTSTHQPCTRLATTHSHTPTHKRQPRAHCLLHTANCMILTANFLSFLSNAFF